MPASVFLCALCVCVSPLLFSSRPTYLLWLEDIAIRLGYPFGASQCFRAESCWWCVAQKLCAQLLTHSDKQPRRLVRTKVCSRAS